MTEICELIVNDAKSRDDIVIALVKNGYTVSVEEERKDTPIWSWNYRIKVRV